MYLQKLLLRADKLIEGTLRIRYFNIYYWRFKYISVIIQSCIISIFLLGILLHLIESIRTRKFVYAENAEDFSGLVSAASAYYLIYVHYTQKHIVIKLIDNFSDFRVYEKPTTFDLTNRNMCLAGMAFSFGLNLIGMSAFLLFVSIDCPNGSEDGCGLVMPIKVPIIDLKTMTGRLIVLLSQVIGGFGVATDTFLIAWVYNTLCLLLGAYIHHLMDMLKELKCIPNPIERRQHFRKCVIYHQRIIELADIFFPLAGNILVIHVVNSPVVMSMIAFQLLDGFDIVFAAHFGIWFSATLVNCMIGQRIKNTSELLIECTYLSMPWEGDSQLGRDMKLMLLRSQKTFLLTGGSLISMDMMLFVTIVKTAYSYLALFSDTN